MKNRVINFFKTAKVSNPFYNLLWKDRNIFLKYIYILIPIFMVVGLIYGVVTDGAWDIGENIYSFSDDYSNTYVATFVLIFIYFSHGFFTEYFERKIQVVKQYFNINTSHRLFKKNAFTKNAIFVLSVFVSLFALVFLSIAASKGELNWYSYLSDFNFVFYCLLVLCCWLLSANFFMLIIYYNICLIEYTKLPLITLDFFNKDKYCGFRKIFKCIAASLGFGIFFSIYVGIIGYSDYRAYMNFGLKFGCYENWEIVLLAFSLLAIFYFTVILHSGIRLKARINEAVDNEITKYALGTPERTFLEKVDISFLNFGNVVTFLSTFVLPFITAIVTVFSSQISKAIDELIK